MKNILEMTDEELSSLTKEEVWEYYSGPTYRLEDIPEELQPDDLTDEDVEKIIRGSNGLEV